MVVFLQSRHSCLDFGGFASFQSQFGEHGTVFFCFGIIRCQQFFTVENGIGASQETECLNGFAQFMASGRHTDTGLWHDNTGDGNCPDKFKRIKLLDTEKRCSRNRNQMVDRYCFGVWIQVGELGNQFGTVADAIHPCR